MKASVVIPTYNRAEILKYCLHYVSKQTTSDYEIICVDDASEDGTYKIAKKFPKVKYIKLDKRSGPYYARNVGIKEAKGELIIFIDSDVIVYNKFVEDHILIHQKNSKIMLQGMVHHIRNIKDLTFNFIIPNSIFTGVFVTQNVSVEKKYLIEVGFFSTFGTRMGHKDKEMGLKLKKLGLKFVYAFRKCKACHIDGPYNKERLKEYINQHYECGYSSYFFIKKWDREGIRLLNPNKSIFFSNLFQTYKWVEKNAALSLLEKSVDFPIPFVFPIFRGIVKHHYRAKGMKDAKLYESISNNANI